jgi:hypothetical protein
LTRSKKTQIPAIVFEKQKAKSKKRKNKGGFFDISQVECRIRQFE